MVLEQPLMERIMKCRKSKSGKTTFSKHKIGILIAGYDINNPEDIAIGYSLCHKKDRFDFVEGDNGRMIRSPGYGKYMAETRALDWINDTCNPVPSSIVKQLNKFIERCVKYYQGKRLPHWTFDIKGITNTMIE